MCKGLGSVPSATQFRLWKVPAFWPIASSFEIFVLFTNNPVNKVIKPCPQGLHLPISLPAFFLFPILSPPHLPHTPEGAAVLDFVASFEAERQSLACFHCQFNRLLFLHPLQSLEPLPASGPDFGGLGEEAEFVEVEPEAKQEILENKDVSILQNILTWLFLEYSLGKALWRSKGALLSPIAGRETWLQDRSSSFLRVSWMTVGVSHGWRDCSVGESTGCPCTWPGFGFQYSYGGSKPSVALALGSRVQKIKWFFWPPQALLTCNTKTCMQVNTQMHNIKFKKFFKDRLKLCLSLYTCIIFGRTRD